MTKIFDLIPGWIYAIAVAALLIFVGLQTVRLAGEEKDHANTRTVYAEERTLAAQALTVATGNVLKLERQLGAAKDQQEKTDAANRKKSEAQGRVIADLRARNDGRLRDPNATSCTGTGPAVATGSSSGAGAADATQSGGLLSEPISRLFERLTREADEINDAYASCRADALTLRATLPP